MDITTALLFVVTLFICVIISKTIGKGRGKASGAQLPGPKPLPIIGNALDVDFESLHLSLFGMVKTYGALFQIKLFGQTAVVINDVELVKKAFSSSTYGDNFNDRPDTFFGKYVCFDSSDITFANMNKKTVVKRKMFHRALKFYGDGVEHFEETANEELDRLMKDMRNTCQQDFDMSDIIKKSFANTTSTLMTGKPADKDDPERLWKLIDITNQLVGGLGFVFDFLPIVRLLPGTFGNMYREAVVARDLFLDKYYSAVRDSSKITYDREQYESGMVKSLIRLEDEINKHAKTEIITESDMKGIVLDVVIASTDSTASILINALALLLTHPKVAMKIQNEVDDVVGSSRMPRFSDREAMPYTMATVFEILRYTSCAAPLSIPHKAFDDKNFEGYFIERNSIILPNHWFIHHDPQLWENPWVFEPERFLDSDGLLLPPEHSTRRNLLAFSTGHRECPGENFGKSRVFLYMAAIFQSFDIIPASDGKLPNTDPRDYLPGAVLKVKPHCCRAIPRM